MKNTTHTLRAILVGLISAQLIGTIQVYRSDLALFRAVRNVSEAGYLGVPNSLVLPSLLKINSALAGGLFFTLSLGAGLTLLAWLGALAWSGFSGRSGKFLILPIAIWLLLIAAVSANGFNLLAALYFLIIPPAVFVAALFPDSRGRQQITQGMLRYLPAIGLLIMVFLWLPLAKNDVFINLRDHLLLTNTIGRKINDAYYRFTLYPAQTIKNLDQKTIKTVFLEQTGDTRDLRSILTDRFLQYDYIPIADPDAADLYVRTSGPTLFFQYGNREILHIPQQEFIKHPGEILGKISGQVDSLAFFRTFTGAAVLIAFPIMLYVLLHGLIFFAGGFFLSSRQAYILATLAVFLAGLLLAAPMYLGKRHMTAGANTTKALKSAIWQERVAGLRALSSAGKSPLDILNSEKVATSPHIAERYWYVKAVGNSPAGSPGDLIRFLDDPNANVVCMTYEALGKKGDPGFIELILSRFKNERHWYVQWYAYRALRRLGWHQE